jgi:MSHA pilin protein MshA
MKQIQRGFTLIELVMVIVILGVLAAVAIPKFVDLKGDAQTAAVQATAGAAAAASSINYAACSAGNAACETIASCDDVKKLLTGAAWPDASYAASGTLATVCTLTSNTKAATYQAIATTK